jgi:TPR repeat protein
MQLLHSPIRLRSARTSLVLVAIAALVAGGVSLAARLPLAARASSLAVVLLSGAAQFLLGGVSVPLGNAFGSRRFLDQETSLRCSSGDATDPLRLGVHPAVESPGSGDGERGRPPRYVPRDIDDDLDKALGDERLVLLLGDAVAGKSRAAYEALRRLPSGWWVLVPRDAGSLRRLADRGVQLRDTVIWLDDLDRYLGIDGLDLGLLEKLTGEPGKHVVVLASIRTGAYEDHGPVGAGLRAERELLDSARVFRLSRQLSRAEQVRAVKAARDDSRIAAALAASAEGIGLAEFLAAAPRLWERWRNGWSSDVQPAGAAIVAAAIDCRRAWLVRPVSEQLLRDLYHTYLDDQIAGLLGPDAFQAGLDWALAPVHATSALLSRRGDGYRVFDYLLDRVQRDSRAAPVPDATWNRLIADLPADDAAGIGFAAYSAGRMEAAEAAFRVGMTASDPHAVTVSVDGLGLVHRHKGELGDAERCFRQVIDREGHERLTGIGLAAAGSLGRLLRQRGDRAADGEAETWLRRAARGGFPYDLIDLGRLLRDRGEYQEAEDLFRRAAASGSATGTIELGHLLGKRGDAQGAEQAFRQAARRGSARAAALLGDILLRRHDEEQAVRWLRVAALAGDLDAANQLASALVSRNELAEARGWLENAADAGDAPAAYNLAMLLMGWGDTVGAERRFRQAAQAGGFIAAHNLAFLLMEQGKLDEAERWLHVILGAGAEDLAAHQSELAMSEDLRVTAMLNLASIAVDRGKLHEAARWYAAAAADDGATESQRTSASAQLALARKEVRRQASERWKLRRAARSGDPDAVITLAILCFSQGKPDAAERLLSPLASADNADAKLNLAALQHQRGETFTLDELAETEDPRIALGVIELAVASGQLDAARRCITRHGSAMLIDQLIHLGIELQARAMHEQAVWVLEQAAAAEPDYDPPVAGGAARRTRAAASLLGNCLLRLGREDEARPWLQLAAETGNPGAEYNLALVLKHQGKVADAEYWYRRAAAHGNPDAWYNLGMLLLEQDRAADAEEWLRKSAQAGDHDGENALGVMLMDRGSEAEAEELFHRAAIAGHRGAWANLGSLLARQGRIEELQPWLPHPRKLETETLTWVISPEEENRE